MTATIIQFKKRQAMKKKRITNEYLLELMMKHSKLIESRRKRGFSAEAIAKAVLEAEQKK